MRVGPLSPTTTLVGLVALGWVGALAGCQSGGDATGSPAGASPPASALQHPLLENIPLPAGFYLVPERSVARAAGSLRVAQCEFQGSLSPDAVARFYVEYMPAAKFTLRQRRFDNGEHSLRFESDAEECNVRTKPKGGKTVLVVDIGPLSKGFTEREGQPPVRRP